MYTLPVNSCCSALNAALGAGSCELTLSCRLTGHMAASFRQINLMLVPNPSLWGTWRLLGALQCVSGLWTGGGLCPASLEHGPGLAHVWLCSGQGDVPSHWRSVPR